MLLLALLGGDLGESASFIPTQAPRAEGRVSLEAADWALRAPLQNLHPRAPYSYLTPNGEAGNAMTLTFHPLTDSSKATWEARVDGGPYIQGTGGEGDFFVSGRQESTRGEWTGPFELQAICRAACILLAIPAEGGAHILHTSGAGAGDLPPPDTRVPPFHLPLATQEETGLGEAQDVALYNASGGVLSLHGDFTLFVWQAKLRLLTSEGAFELDTGDRSGSGPLPREPSDRVRWAEGRLLKMELRGMRAELAEFPEAGVLLTASDPIYDVEGVLTAKVSHGQVGFGETERPIRSRDLRLEGAFTVRPSCDDALLDEQVTAPAGDGCSYEVTGRVNRVFVGGHPMFARPTAAVAGLAGLAAAALAFLHRAQEPLRAALWTLYSRIRPGDALAQPQREEIYRYLGEKRVVTRKTLAAAMGFSPGVLGHHLQVLQRSGYVRSRAIGRNRFLWATTRAPGNEELEKLSALVSGRARRYAEHVLRSPGIIQRDLAKAEGAPRSNANYHLGRLAAVGLVRAERLDGSREIRYFPTKRLPSTLEEAADVLNPH